jgi:uncharacterized membrane protein
MPSPDRSERNVVLGIVVVAVLTLLYTVVIAQQILAWFGIAIPLVFLYLLWRLVRAHERVATALED